MKEDSLPDKPACYDAHLSQEDELLDVVDLDDNVVGTASRGRVHRENLCHRAVHIFLFNSSGEIYVQRRSRWKDRHPLKLDSSAAGHVESGETYRQTAGRELLEELGIEAELVQILKFSPCPETDNEHVMLFEAKSDAVPVPNDREILEGWFVEPDELERLIEIDKEDFVPAFVLLWKLFVNRTSS